MTTDLHCVLAMGQLSLGYKKEELNCEKNIVTRAYKSNV